MASSSATRPAASPAAGTITADLLAWYDRSRRALPWRALPHEPADPYAVWLSEIMLQQTTVQAVKPYFTKFLALWPTVDALAAAPLEEVMRAWAGLGYYSRARNLHACAIAIMRDYGGRFPTTEATLLGLPGIGAYTAAAIAAIAFGRQATVVDGNVERVMARLYGIDAPHTEAKPLMRARMAAATPAGRAGDFAQAVMDLGATICTPRSPACAVCPVIGACVARRMGLQADLPRRKAKAAVPLRHGVVYFITNVKGEVLVRRRPSRGLLGGMVELPGSDWVTVATEPPVPASDHPGQLVRGRVTHMFTHFTLFLDVICSDDAVIAGVERAACWFIDPLALDLEALPTLMRRAIDLARLPATPSRPARPPASRRRRMS